MKKLLILLIAGFMTLGATAQFSKATLQATGLTCAMCSNAINKALEEVPFVASVRSDIKNSAFNIVFKENTPVSIDAIRKAVEDAGFSVGGLKVTGQFNHVAIGNDKHIEIGNAVFHFLDIKSNMLDGEQTLTVVDKNFVSAKQFKKISGATKMSCLQTGKAASCCVKDGVKEDARIYHVTI
ncbi:MAG TPA: heavy-metal-associated domain-containing protein [Chitinophagaceae bacterium]|nr:heavy-metal-associated domain-containing protein [Chitinophagaceae bacterium]